MRTLLALVAATAMIAAALYVRGDGADDGGGILDGPSAPAALVCVSELAEVCEALASDDVTVTVEEAGVTAARLSRQGPVAHDAWLTLAPWPTLVAEARDRATLPALPGDPGPPLARSPLVMVAAAQRVGILERACRGEVTWSCLGNNAGRAWSEVGGEPGWGQIKPGFTDPAVSASGLLVLGQAATEFLGRSDFSARDLEPDAFFSWLTQLEAGVPGHGRASNTPLQQQLQLGAASFDVVGTTEAEAGPLLEGSPRAGTLELRYPESVVVAEVVLAPLSEAEGAQRLQELLEEVGKAELALAGWRVDGEPAAPGIADDPLPAKANVPAAGVLDALRARWGEIAR